MQQVHLICNSHFSLDRHYSSHTMVFFAIVIIIVNSLHCHTNIPTISGLESGGAWGTTFLRDFCQIINKYDIDIQTVMPCQSLITVRVYLCLTISAIFETACIFLTHQIIKMSICNASFDFDCLVLQFITFSNSLSQKITHDRYTSLPCSLSLSS